MKQNITFLAFSLITCLAIAQVGIGTTNPSPAANLEVSGTTNGVGPYRGFMPARVPTQTNKNSINANANDVGLLIFVNSTSTLEMWNGVSWEILHTLAATIVPVTLQDFDANTSWSYTVTPAFYNVTDDIWSIVNSLPDITSFTGNFLGCRDLDNPNGGGAFLHEIAFDNVDVSSVTNAKISFGYDVFEFDGGDNVFYEVFFDDLSQGSVQLIVGMNGGGISATNTEVINVPDTVTNVRITISIEQDGAPDKAGFDNFQVYGL